MENCCYFFSLRMGCILSGLWLLLYYSGLAYLMYYEIQHTNLTQTEDSHGLYSYKKVTIGFWVLGIDFLVLDFMSFLFLLGVTLVTIH